MNQPEPLARMLERSLRGIDLDQRLRESKAMGLWAEIVGEVTANKTRPLHVNRGTLVIEVASSAWAQQLNLLKPRLLGSIEARVGPGVIRDLRFKTGSLTGPTEEGLPLPTPARRNQAALPVVPLEPAELAAIARQTGGVQDPALARSYAKLLEANARRRKRLKAAGWVPCQRCACLHDAAAERTAGPLENARLCPVCRRELAVITAPVPPPPAPG